MIQLELSKVDASFEGWVVWGSFKLKLANERPEKDATSKPLTLVVAPPLS